MTMDLKTAAQQALRALESCTPGDYSSGSVIHPSFDENLCDAAERDLKAVLASSAASQGEPIGYISRNVSITKGQREAFPGEEPDHLWEYRHGTKHLERFERDPNLEVLRLYAPSASERQQGGELDLLPLTFERFRQANRARCLKWHPEGIESWSASDWMTAIVGELGELASLIKMRNRERDGLPGNKFSPTSEMIAKEAADVFTYLDLFCEMHGIDLGQAAAEKFNEVSERVGFPDRIDLGSA